MSYGTSIRTSCATTDAAIAAMTGSNAGETFSELYHQTFSQSFLHSEDDHKENRPVAHRRPHGPTQQVFRRANRQGSHEIMTQHCNHSLRRLPQDHQGFEECTFQARPHWGLQDQYASLRARIGHKNAKVTRSALLLNPNMIKGTNHKRMNRVKPSSVEAVIPQNADMRHSLPTEMLASSAAVDNEDDGHPDYASV